MSKGFLDQIQSDGESAAIDKYTFYECHQFQLASPVVAEHSTSRREAVAANPLKLESIPVPSEDGDDDVTNNLSSGMHGAVAGTASPESSRRHRRGVEQSLPDSTAATESDLGSNVDRQSRITIKTDQAGAPPADDTRSRHVIRFIVIKFSSSQHRRMRHIPQLNLQP